MSGSMAMSLQASWRQSLAYRLWWMAWGWGTVGVVYSLTDYWQGAGHVVPETWLDQVISYDQSAIVGYLSFFVLIPAAYLFAELSRVRMLARQMQWGALFCGAIYLLYPTTIVYPPIELGTWTGPWVTWLLHIDSSQNCVPSLHILLSLLAVHAVWHRKSWWVKSGYAGWLVWITYTVLQLKRHLLIDVMAAVVVAIVVIALSAYWRANRAEVQGDAD
ncbi:inositol phosphorylceramide synthase [Paenalcaligenes sp. Me52]|uniref:phosphatase PAP2 family protein n=1 Tax=Paenalcaligenes sp. Me52 TaxID=3392038 RepID=UPI003D2A3A1F